MREGALSVLPKKSCVSPDWFTANKTELLTLIQKRNDTVYTLRLTVRLAGALNRHVKPVKGLKQPSFTQKVTGLLRHATI